MKSRKSIACLILSLCQVFLLASCSGAAKATPTPEVLPTHRPVLATQTPTPTPAPKATPDPTPIIVPSPSPDPTPSPSPSADPEPSVSANKLLAAIPLKASVKNGTGTSTIGTRGYVIVTKENLKSISEADFIEFVDDRVRDSGYNWWSIICDDGTGIVFAGSATLVADYGKVDNEGSITELVGVIMLNSDGGYDYDDDLD